MTPSPASGTPTDPLSDLLSLLAPNSYVAGGLDLAGDWSLAFEPHVGVKCFAITVGRCWLVVEGLPDLVQLAEDDCFMVPGGRSFRLASDPALAPTPFAAATDLEWRGGIAALNGGGETRLLGGHFAFEQAHVDTLLGELPAVALLREGRDKANLRWALDEMRRELVDPRPGGILLAQNLAHTLLVRTLRLYLEDNAGEGTGWLFALADPNLATAISAMHADPARRWTLSMLSREAGMSRSHFAERFRQTVGLAPLDYLTRWRMLLAGNRLRERREPVSGVAYAVGYRSESAFSTAFRRVMAISPRDYARGEKSTVPPHPWPNTAALRSSEVTSDRG